MPNSGDQHTPLQLLSTRVVLDVQVDVAFVPNVLFANDFLVITLSKS